MLGLIPEGRTSMYAAQAAGCGPIVTMIKKDTDVLVPVRPNTIAKSLAIGNPADGYYAYRAVKDSGGYGEHATDEEIVEGMRLLARTEGIFTETAGGVTVAATKKLIEAGRIPRDEPIVICITGNGLKTPDALHDRLHRRRDHPALARRPSTGRWPISSPRRRRSGDAMPCSYGFPRRSARSRRAAPRSRPTPTPSTASSRISSASTRAQGAPGRRGGELRRFINIYVNQEDIRFLQGEDGLKDGDEVSIVPAIAGG